MFHYKILLPLYLCLFPGNYSTEAILNQFRKPTGFYILILYAITLLKVFITSKRFSMETLGILSVESYLQVGLIQFHTFLFIFPIVYSFLLLYCSS
jgi:hypothetical protein